MLPPQRPVEIPREITAQIKKYAWGFAIDVLHDFQNVQENLDVCEIDDLYVFVEHEAVRLFDLTDVQEYFQLLTDAYGSAVILLEFAHALRSVTHDVAVQVRVGS